MEDSVWHAIMYIDTGPFGLASQFILYAGSQSDR